MRLNRADVASRRSGSGRHTLRGVAVVGALTLAVSFVVPLSTAHARELPVADDEVSLVPMLAIDVADFVAEAAELPSELEAALERDAGISGAEWLAQAEASEVGIEVVDALRDHIDVHGARLEGLELVVTVGSASDAEVVESVGAIAEIGARVDRDDNVLGGLQPAADLRGGTPYLFSGNSMRCSVGFVGVDNVTAQAQIMSAGHCEGDGLLRNAATSNLPTVSGGSVGGPLQTIGDAGLHVAGAYPNPGYVDFAYYDLGITPVTGAGWTPKPEVVTWGGSSSGAPLSSAPLVIRDAGPAMVGSTLCKSGATTGWTCGPITGVDQIRAVGPGSTCPPTSSSYYCVGGIVASVCVRSGDSGGAAMVGSRAVGITSASSVISGTCSGGGIAVFSTLYSTNPAFEQVNKVFPRWEPLVAVEQPSLTITGTVFSGTLDQGGTRHSVDVTFSNGEKRSTSVNADGTWLVDTSTTSPITKTYSVVARWRLGSFSTPITGTLQGIDTARLFGADRYATPVEIARAQFPGTSTPTGPVTPGVPVVYLANGASFPDALSAGPASALEGGPMLLTPSSSLPAVVAAELDRLNPQSVVVVGGTGVVSDAVAAAAGSFATSGFVRIGGQDRYETSRLIAARMLANGLVTGQPLWVATGANFPDALSAGAAAAAQGVPILLVNGAASTLDPTTAAFVNGQLQSSVVDIAGGTGAVSAGIQSSLDALASTTSVTRRGGSDRFSTSLLINQAAYGGSAPEVFLAYGFNFPDALAGSVMAGLRGGPLYITETPCVRTGVVEHVLDLSPSRVTVFGGSAIVSDAARDLVRC
ncbi:MAG: hypothetical protein C0444_00540 [Microbacterium sp.]|nr:hypothetical protein [Microbacterium sp.]MBA4346874.1 hypothetical protein [Microbacterium sp.]